MSTAYTTLIAARRLAERIGQPDWCIVDCRHDLADTEFGRRAYQDAHLPGARFLHLDEDLSGAKTGRNGRHPLPAPEALAQRLAACGITRDTQVVAYDDAAGMFAARLWWLMRWLGHRSVAVLDGGLQAWRQSGGALESAVPTLSSGATPYDFALQAVHVDVDTVFAGLGTPGMMIVDARSPDRYRGENEGMDPVGGHIPGALNRFFKDNLDSSGTFKPAHTLKEEFLQVLGTQAPEQVVLQCGSGVTACHNLLALELAGLGGARLYPGSWSEWCADPARPVVTGASPV